MGGTGHPPWTWPWSDAGAQQGFTSEPGAGPAPSEGPWAGSCHFESLHRFYPSNVHFVRQDGGTGSEGLGLQLLQGFTFSHLLAFLGGQCSWLCPHSLARSPQQLLLSPVLCPWSLVGAQPPGGAGPGMYAPWWLRTGPGAGAPASSQWCHGVFSGHLGGVSSHPPQSPAPTTLEYEASIPGGPHAVDGGDRLRRDWLKATSMAPSQWVCWAVLLWASLVIMAGPHPGSVISWQLTWSLGDPGRPCSVCGSWQAVGRGSGSNQVPWRWGTRAASVVAAFQGQQERPALVSRCLSSLCHVTFATSLAKARHSPAQSPGTKKESTS